MRFRKYSMCVNLCRTERDRVMRALQDRVCVCVSLVPPAPSPAAFWPCGCLAFSSGGHPGLLGGTGSDCGSLCVKTCHYVQRRAALAERRTHCNWSTSNNNNHSWNWVGQSAGSRLCADMFLPGAISDDCQNSL